VDRTENKKMYWTQGRSQEPLVESLSLAEIYFEDAQARKAS